VGKLQYSLPTTMQEGVIETVELAITANFSTPLEKSLGDNVSTPASVKVSTVMSARLTGSGFDVVPVTDERQVVGSGTTMWVWHVTPRQSGRNVLQLVVAVHIIVKGFGDAPSDYTVFQREIEVRVDWPRRIGGFLADNWQWFFTFVFGAAGTGLGVRVWNSRRGKERSKKPRKVPTSRRRAPP
jgi:hypothetical protein